MKAREEHKFLKTNGLLLLAAILLLIIPIPSSADVVSEEYKLKAELLERFTRFIDWPTASSVSDPNTPFVIGVIGNDPFRTYLDHLKDTKIKDKKVDVREVDDLSQLDQCQVLFISASQEKNLDEIVRRVNGKPVLTISDTNGFAQRGVLINFYREGEYERFEVNQTAADRSGLKFSSRLMKLARLVTEKK